MFIRIRTLEVPSYQPEVVEVRGEIILPVGELGALVEGVTPTVVTVVNKAFGATLRLDDILMVEVRPATDAEVHDLAVALTAASV